MLQWDLSDTPLAQRDSALKAPTEGELYVLLVGLLLARGLPFDSLRSCEIVFQPDEREKLAQVMEYRIPVLAHGVFGNGNELRQRLMELLGIRVASWPEQTHHR
mgnify:CR=1 FL=1